ncbi:hypothetical protein F5Y08DRAFT_297500 [Xylaria arbuscula]|nr:hypothetical protein F5Y08DRAFT_297500 [Xylaria arbuscula]
MDTINTPSSSADKGPMTYLSTSKEGRSPTGIIAIGAMFGGLPAFFIAMRFYSRTRVTKARLGLDDWLMFLAFVLNVGLRLMLIIGASLHGLGQPTPQG